MKKLSILILISVLGSSLFISSCDEDSAENPVLTVKTASISADVTTIVAGGMVTFTDNSENAVSRTWNFPGGEPTESEEAVVEVTYLEAGSFVATAQVTFDDGSSKIERIAIEVVQSVSAAFSADVTTVILGDPVQFTDESTGGADVWQWVFEGGTPATSTSQNPQVTYDAEGTYDVTLIVTRSDVGSVDTLVMEDMISANRLDDPIVAFTADVTAVDVGGSVTFTNSTVGGESYVWTFAGGSPATSTDVSPTITYSTAGVYDVQLVATNAGGEVDTTVVDYVIVREVQPANVINDNGNFETFDLDGDRLTINPWREFNGFANDGSSDKIIIEFNGKSYVGSGGTFDLDETITAQESYSGNAHYRVIQGELNSTDPGIDWDPSDNAIQLEAGKTYRISMMIKVLSSGDFTWSEGAQAGNTFPAAVMSFGRAVNGWGGLGGNADLSTFTPNTWVEHSWTWECTAVNNPAVGFPVLRFQGECDVLIDNVYVTEEP